MNNTSKNILLSVLGVAILVVAVVGVSFAAFTWNSSQTGDNIENTITTGAITISYVGGNGITLSDAMPMTDTEGRALVNTTGADAVTHAFEFTITPTITGSATLRYDILADAKSGNDLSADDVKILLTDGKADVTSSAANDKLAPTVFSSINTAATTTAGQALAATGAKVIETGTFTSSSTAITRTLRMWVRDGATVPDAQKTFIIIVKAFAEQ